MISAFGVEHGGVSKGLPSALRGAKALKPGGYGALRQQAHAEGKYVASMEGEVRHLHRIKAPNRMSVQYLSSTARQKGQIARLNSKELGGTATHPHNPRAVKLQNQGKRVLP
jgi:hypothetical protein